MNSDVDSVILIIEADENLAQNISTDLQNSGYNSCLAFDGHSALQRFESLNIDLMVIDRYLPDMCGFKLCKQFRQQGFRQPILILMSHESLDDRVQCLESGADDYCLKPYRSTDLMRLIQIYIQPDLPSRDQLRFSDLVLDLGTHQVLRGGRVIDLTMKEFELLKYLMEHPREVLSREQILENVWGYDFMGESNVIEVYIRYLRLKIEDDGDKRLIQTVRGVGYVLREN
jgi:OmpR family response regulator NblR